MDTRPHRTGWQGAAIACLALGVLGGCGSKSPQDQQADAIKTAAGDQAKQIEQRADAQAQGLDQQADALRAQAKQAGGYTGDRLKVQGDALSREADIVKKQGQAQADATREAADARAKAIASR